MFSFQKGEPRAIHREIVAAYRAYIYVRERALFQMGYSNSDEAVGDGLVDRLIPLDLKRASQKAGVARAGRWPHKLADLPRFEDNPDLPYTVNELQDMKQRDAISRWAEDAARFRAEGAMQASGIKPNPDANMVIDPWGRWVKRREEGEARRPPPPERARSAAPLEP